MHHRFALSVVLIAPLLGAGCSSPEVRTLPAKIAEGLAAACPVTDRADVNAKAECADALTRLDLLRDAMQEPFIWGGQSAEDNFDLTVRMNKFNALVWRRMYLSLFMFTGEYRIEDHGEQTHLYARVEFRNDLDIGEYPYPFWHSTKKWDGYQRSPEIIFIFEDDALIAAMRSAKREPRPEINHTWKGLWRWTEGDQEQPYVALYTYLLSPNNPHVAALDAAYKELEAESRQHACLSCHSPDNIAEIGRLEFFNYPNQALAGRYDLVEQLEANKMPPANDLHLPVGIADEAQRLKLLGLARAFRDVGDEALAFEGELKTQAE